MLTAMMIIVYDLREAMGIYHAATAIMIALAVYGGGTFAFLNRQREWITSDNQDKQELRILLRMRATALKAGFAVPQIALALPSIAGAFGPIRLQPISQSLVIPLPFNAGTLKPIGSILPLRCQRRVFLA